MEGEKITFEFQCTEVPISILFLLFTHPFIQYIFIECNGSGKATLSLSSSTPRLEQCHSPVRFYTWPSNIKMGKIRNIQ